MDLVLLIGIAVALLIVIITIFFLQQKSTKKGDQPKQQHQTQRGTAVRSNEGVPRRAQIARNQRNRLRNNAAANVAVDNDVVEEATEEPSTSAAFSEEKMGAKKRAKMEAKADKRAQREQEMKAKEERKAREEKLEEEKKKLEEKEAEAEKKAAEAERLAREERERKEYEEYLKMKAGFSIEEEGFDEDDESQKENLLQEFVQYIKDNKVVVLEELAVHFKLKTQQVIDRITELQENDTLTGVIDDRGKFIYISEEELLAMAKFITQRGRVSISELAESSNQLINLTPVSK